MSTQNHSTETPAQPTALQTFDVHLFAVIRQKFPGIQAADMPAAIQAAIDSTAAERWLSHFRAENASCDALGEFVEEFSQYLVDVAGDADFGQSRWYSDSTNQETALLLKLVQWADSQHQFSSELDEIVAEARKLTENHV
jgi:hypothetical protein